MAGAVAAMPAPGRSEVPDAEGWTDPELGTRFNDTASITTPTGTAAAPAHSGARRRRRRAGVLNRIDRRRRSTVVRGKAAALDGTSAPRPRVSARTPRWPSPLNGRAPSRIDDMFGALGSLPASPRGGLAG